MIVAPTISMLATLSEEHAALLTTGSPAHRRRIFLESGGNPFYMEQLARSHRSAAPASNGAPAATGIPATVTAAIAEELRHLPADARRLLEGAAVTGDPFEPELAAEACGLAPGRALELLDVLVAHDCVRPQPAGRLFRFRHPIVRRAVYDSMAPGRRLAAHGRAAAAAGRIGAPVSARAHHIALSARPGDATAITILTDAATQVSATSPASAARWLAVALSLLPADQPSQRLSLLSPLAQAQAAAGALADARETLIQITADASAQPEAGWSQAVAALASVELALGRHSGARRRLELALTTLGDPSSPQAVPLLVALAMDVSYHGDFTRGTEACVTALAAAEGGDPALRVIARAVLALMLELQGAGQMNAAKETTTLAAAEFDALTDAQIAGQLDLPYYLGLVETLLERFDEAARHLQRGVSIALAGGNSQFIVSTRAFLTYALHYQGRLGEALAVAGEAVETARLLRVPAVTAWALSTAALAHSAVDARAAVRLAEEALTVLDSVDDSMLADTTHGHFAQVCAYAGEYDRCITHMELAGAPSFARFGEPGRLCFWAEAMVRSTLATGRRPAAREWAMRAEAFGSGLGLPVAEAAATRAGALVRLADGDAGAAAELALHATGVALAHGARIEAGRSQIVAGRALAAAGHRDQAVDELRGARTRLIEDGARRLSQEAARELRLLGAAAPAPVARRPGDSGTQQLSRREREIAGLVAAGNSNPEIAQALYLSPKTIEGHMRRIFAKLSVSSRAEVAATVASEEARREQRV